MSIFNEAEPCKPVSYEDVIKAADKIYANTAKRMDNIEIFANSKGLSYLKSLSQPCLDDTMLKHRMPESLLGHPIKQSEMIEDIAIFRNGILAKVFKVEDFEK